MNLPYDRIETRFHAAGDFSDYPVEFKFGDDEFVIQRQGDDGIEIDLTFPIANAKKLRDFLNFALPERP